MPPEEHEPEELFVECCRIAEVSLCAIDVFIAVLNISLW
jgi:hypothetical protein